MRAAERRELRNTRSVFFDISDGSLLYFATAAGFLLVTHPCEHRSPEGRTEGNESRGADYCCDEATKIDNSFIFSKNRLYAIAI